MRRQSMGVVAIVGVGLIGGSIGLALRRRRLAKEVIGIGRNPARLRLAEKMGAVDRWSVHPRDAGGADVVILCTPVKRIVRDLSAILPHAQGKPTVFTDVGSTKEYLVRTIESRLRGSPHAYVGAHPMAGSEKTGVENADDRLFENAAVILTPTPRTPRAELSKIRDLWRSLGGRVMELPPKDHDRACAFVSHLPHLVAYSLVHALKTVRQKSLFEVLLQMSAGSFRDTTRIADSDPSIWSEIFETNAAQIDYSARAFLRQVRRMIGAVRSRRFAGLRSAIQDAGELRRHIQNIRRGLADARYELVVNVPDRPGQIARLAVPLARRRVNVADIEVLHVREGVEGNIRLAFRSRSERAAAARYLRKTGCTVILR